MELNTLSREPSHRHTKSHEAEETGLLSPDREYDQASLTGSALNPDDDLSQHDKEDEDRPTAEELRTLPRVPDRIPFNVYTVAFVELCERFSYYGTQILFQNFVQRSLRTPTGRAPDPGGDVDNNPGALGQGQQVATALSTFFSFWCYVTPLLGAWVADTYLGRYKTIMISVGFALLGHLILTVAALPVVLANTSQAFVVFVIALIVFGLGTGGFKPNISPLIAEQVVSERLRVEVDRRGRRVIVDPAQTSARIYNWFYLFINVGAMIGQISMAYAALYVGYYLAFLLPTLMFLLCPIVLVMCKKSYRLTPPEGSVLGPAFKLFFFATSRHVSLLHPVRSIRALRETSSTAFWDAAKPSHLPTSRRPKWMTFNDAWVDELRRGFKACAVFLWYPLYWLTYNQINNNLTSQADTMQHAGVPPEVVANLDPLVLVVLIPVCDLLVYPFLRSRGVKITPIRKITLGFWAGALAMAYACGLQWYIYTHNACGFYPSEGPPGTDHDDPGACPPARISIWFQAPVYILIAVSEILASVTSLEYAFTKAPQNMRSMVQAFSLLMAALANLIGEALIWLSRDPMLAWNYGAMALVAAAAGWGFWRCNRALDDEEDALNTISGARVGLARHVRSSDGEEDVPLVATRRDSFEPEHDHDS